MSKTYLLVAVVPSAKNVNCLPAKFLLCLPYTIVIEINEILQTTPPILRRERGMGRNPGDSNIRGTALLYEYSYAYPSLMWPRCRCSIPDTWNTVHTSTKQATESEVRGSVSRARPPSEQGLPHYRCCKKSNSFSSCDGREGETQLPDGA